MIRADGFFVDSGLVYEGDPATVISGLDHLEGKEVAIFADGAVKPSQVVSNGEITLDAPASRVVVGLAYAAEVETLPMAVQTNDSSFGQGRMKNVNKVWLRVHDSSGMFAGPAEGKLVEHKPRTTEPYGTPPVLKSEEVAILVPPAWQDGGKIHIRSPYPLPFTLVAMTAEVAIGG